ncbi:MAG: hypothetical protein ACJA2T_001601, partial [Gammaproteobacteria bacterium]
RNTYILWGSFEWPQTPSKLTYRYLDKLAIHSIRPFLKIDRCALKRKGLKG